MLLKVATETQDQGYENQRHNRRGQNGVRSQDGEVDRTDPACSLKSNRPGVEVVVEVRNQEQGRAAYRGNHAGTVGSNSSLVHEAMSGDHQHGASGVEERIDGGKN